MKERFGSLQTPDDEWASSEDSTQNCRPPDSNPSGTVHFRGKLEHTVRKELHRIELVIK